MNQFIVLTRLKQLYPKRDLKLVMTGPSSLKLTMDDEKNFTLKWDAAREQAVYEAHGIDIDTSIADILSKEILAYLSGKNGTSQ